MQPSLTSLWLSGKVLLFRASYARYRIHSSITYNIGIGLIPKRSKRMGVTEETSTTHLVVLIS